MVFGNDPGLEGQPGGEGLEDDKFLSIHHNPLPIVEFLLNRVAIDTPSMVIVISGCLFQLFSDIGWNNTGSYDLRMSVFQRCSSRLPMILKNDDQLNPRILPDGKVSLAISEEYLFHLFIIHQRKKLIMNRASNHHLMDSYPVHHPEEPFLFFPFQTSFRRKSWKFIGYDSYPPSLTIGRTTTSIGEGLRRGEGFVAWTEREVLFICGFFDGGSNPLKLMRSL